MKIRKYFSTSIILIPALLILDQFSKYIIRRISGFYICNRGIAFGIDLPEKSIWLLSLAIIFAFVILIFRKSLYQQSLPIILILAGALSNLIDRLHLSCVIDFIDLKFWPVFNLADIYITTGVIMLVIGIIGNKRNKSA